MEKIIYITSIQKLLLNKWQKGLKKDTEIFGLLRTHVNNIPSNLSDKQSIEYLCKHAKLSINCIHANINWKSAHWDEFIKKYGSYYEYNKHVLGVNHYKNL